MLIYQSIHIYVCILDSIKALQCENKKNEDDLYEKKIDKKKFSLHNIRLGEITIFLVNIYHKEYYRSKNLCILNSAVGQLVNVC